MLLVNYTFKRPETHDLLRESGGFFTFTSSFINLIMVSGRGALSSSTEILGSWLGIFPDMELRSHSLSMCAEYFAGMTWFNLNMKAVIVKM